MGCFWGAERKFWQAPGRLHDRGRLRRRVDAEPDLQGGLLGPDRAHRGGAGRLRSRADELRGAAARLLGGPRSHPGDAAGQRRRHAVPLGDLHLLATRSARRPRRRATRTSEALTEAGYGPITTEIAEAPARSTTPRTTTSSTSPRIPTATAASAARASPARSASRPRRPSRAGYSSDRASVQVKRVIVPRGASPPGRRPLRTSRAGGFAARSTASRTEPMPS